MIRIALAQEDPQKRDALSQKRSHTSSCRSELCLLLFSTVSASPALLLEAQEEQERRLASTLVETTLLDDAPAALLRSTLGCN